MDSRRYSVPCLKRHRHRRIALDVADAVDARDTGDDDGVGTLQDRPGCRVAHAVDLLVPARFLLDVGVGPRHVGFRLVVVVVGDEVLDGVVRKEAPEFAVELCREGLVGRQHQRRTSHALDHLGHGIGLAGSGDAEQHLVALPGHESVHEFPDRIRLIPRRLEIRNQAKERRRHGSKGTVFVERAPASWAQPTRGRCEVTGRVRLRGHHVACRVSKRGGFCYRSPVAACDGGGSRTDG